jgi:ankyrin repeat protein
MALLAVGPNLKGPIGGGTCVDKQRETAVYERDAAEQARMGLSPDEVISDCAIEFRVPSGCSLKDLGEVKTFSDLNGSEFRCVKLVLDGQILQINSVTDVSTLESEVKKLYEKTEIFQLNFQSKIICQVLIQDMMVEILEGIINTLNSLFNAQDLNKDAVRNQLELLDKVCNQYDDEKVLGVMQENNFDTNRVFREEDILLYMAIEYNLSNVVNFLYHSYSEIKGELLKYSHPIYKAIEEAMKNPDFKLEILKKVASNGGAGVLDQEGELPLGLYCLYNEEGDISDFEKKTKKTKEIIDILIENGGDIHHKDRSLIPYYCTVYNSEVEWLSGTENSSKIGVITKYLIEITSTPIMKCIHNEDYSGLQDIFDGINPRLDDIRADGMTPLMIAVNNQNSKAVRILLEKSSETINNCNYYGNNALKLAVLNQDLEMVKLLCKYNASIVQNTFVDLPEFGEFSNQISTCSPLVFAIKENNVSIINYFLENTDDLTQPDFHKSTVLTIASELLFDNPEIIKEILDKDFGDINGVDNDGDTALMCHIISRNPNIEVIKLLLDKKINPSIANKKKKTAYTVAIDKELPRRLQIF